MSDSDENQETQTYLKKDPDDDQFASMASDRYATEPQASCSSKSKSSNVPKKRNEAKDRPTFGFPMFFKATVCVDLSYIMTSPDHSNILSVTVREIKKDGSEESEHVESSAGDVPKTVEHQVPTVLKYETRKSYSGSSSISSLGLPASVIKTLTHSQPISKHSVKLIKSKWENLDLLLNVIKYLEDNVRCPSRFDIAHDLALSSDTDSSVSTSPTKSVRSDVSNQSKRLKLQASFEEEEFFAGEEVYARWMDGRYYFGELLDRGDDDGTWKALFYDGETKIIQAATMIRNDPEILIGHNTVYFCKEEPSRVRYAIIMGYCGNNYYKLLSNFGDHTVRAKDMYFVDSHVADIRLNMKKAREVIIPVGSPKPSVSGIISKPRTVTRHEEPQKESDSSDDAFLKETKTDYPGILIGCKKEIQFNSKGCVKLKSCKGKLPKSHVDDNIVGPVKTLKLFEGLNFLLTCDDSSSVMNVTEDVSTDNESYEFTKVPYVYDRLYLQITSAGGKIYDLLFNVPINEYNTTYLVAPRPCLTEKYIESVALNISMVCHEWIVNCIKQEKLLPVQSLPLGWSIQRNKFINKYDRTNIKPLHDITIAFMQVIDLNFVHFWSRICTLAGATICYYKKNKSVSYILGHEMFIPLLKDVADKATIVTTAWVVQCLINGCAINPLDNPSSFLIMCSP